MDGSRVMHNDDNGKKKGWIIAGALLAVVLAAYVGLCAWVMSSGQILAHVSMGGAELSGMTREQAAGRLEELWPEGDVGRTVSVQCGDYRGRLEKTAFRVDYEACAQDAWTEGRQQFLLSGWNYLSHAMGTASELEMGHVAFTQRGERDFLAMLRDVEAKCGVVYDENAYETDLERGVLVLTKGVTNYALEEETARAEVLQAFLDALDGGEGRVELTARQQPPRHPDFQGMHGELYARMKEPEIDPVTYAVSEHTVGVDFKISDARNIFEKTAEGAEYEIPLTVTNPKHTKEELESKLFADVLGEGLSVVTGTASRRENVRLAALACNEKVLMPGEVFSYNDTTGSRTADKGYLPAPIYRGGKSEEDVGGGICQVSSTLYYAVLCTTLEVVERYPHQFAVGYVPDGMDATVFFGSKDFKFKNSTEYPLKIVTESYDKNGKRYLSVTLYGTNEDGRYGVPERVQSDFVEPTITYKPDETVARGTLVLDTVQNAYTGRKAQTYRHIYESDGTFVETQDMGLSKYNMRPHVYFYNPLDGDPTTWVDGVPPQPAPETPVVPEPVVPDPVIPDPAVPAEPEQGEESDPTLPAA